MATRIAFVGSLAAPFAELTRQKLTVPHEIVFADETSVVDVLPEVDVLVSLVFTPEMAAAARRLKLLQVPGAGLDRIDRAVLPPGAALANAFGHDVGIAEYVMGAILTLTRELGRLDAKLRRGEWESHWVPDKPPPTPWPELAGRSLGILGFGRIGQAVARRALAFDMAVTAIRRRPDHETVGESVTLLGPDSLPALLSGSDVLVVTLPLSEETRGLIGESELNLMKSNALLINVARAPILDEAALFRALSEGRIAGAALDVWNRYPSDDSPTSPSAQSFHELPNVLITPHISGWTEGMLNARAEVIAENVGRVLAGEPLLNPV